MIDNLKIETVQGYRVDDNLFLNLEEAKTFIKKRKLENIIKCTLSDLSDININYYAELTAKALLKNKDDIVKILGDWFGTYCTCKRVKKHFKTYRKNTNKSLLDELFKNEVDIRKKINKQKIRGVRWTMII